MGKIVLLEKLKYIRLKHIIMITIAAAVIIPSLIFLNSIHYKVGDWFWAAFSGTTLKVENFNEHKDEFDLIVKEIDLFIGDHPDFFEEFDGDCSVNGDGLIFFKLGVPYPKSQVFYHVNSEGWETVKNHYKVFPHDYHYGGIVIDRNYPDYIFFRSYEGYGSFLVYTRGGRPNELIDSYWEKYNFVYVRKVSSGWYDIHPGDQKPIID